jgi:hypothetical protein
VSNRGGVLVVVGFGEANLSGISEADFSGIKVGLADYIGLARGVFEFSCAAAYRHWIGDHREQAGSYGLGSQLSRIGENRVA